MKATTIALGALLPLASVMAFTTGSRPARTPRSGFSAEIRGEVGARPSGDARFGLVPSGAAGARVFTLSLGSSSVQGSVLLTRESGARLSPGTYLISDRIDRSDDMRALVMTGSATAPTGVFQGQSGRLVITTASDSLLAGTFDIEAAGFLASSPDVEDRPVTVSGAFAAAAR